jgi:hypothetical protein
MEGLINTMYMFALLNVVISTLMGVENKARNARTSYLLQWRVPHDRPTPCPKIFIHWQCWSFWTALLYAIVLNRANSFLLFCASYVLLFMVQRNATILGISEKITVLSFMPSSYTLLHSNCNALVREERYTSVHLLMIHTTGCHQSLN